PEDGGGGPGHRNRRQQSEDGRADAAHRPLTQGPALRATENANAEDEDEAGRGQAAQEDRLREAQATQGLEEPSAGGEAAEAAPSPPGGPTDLESGRAPDEGARALPLREDAERCHGRRAVPRRDSGARRSSNKPSASSAAAASCTARPPKRFCAPARLR